MAPQQLPTNTSPFRTVEEVAHYLRLSLRQVRRLTADGQIQVTRFGRSVRVHQRDLDAYVGSQLRGGGL